MQLNRTQLSSLSVGLIILSLILISASVIPITEEEVVLDSSFIVESHSSYGPYDDGTVYHPKILGSSILQGEVDVEGGSIYLTINGHYTEGMKDVHILQTFSFQIPNAHEQYNFLFNNTSDSSASVHLILVEVWTRSLTFISPVSTLISIGVGVLIAIGLLITIQRRLKQGYRRDD